MKERNLWRHGIRNVAAIHWHLPFAALDAKTAPRGEMSKKNCYY